MTRVWRSRVRVRAPFEISQRRWLPGARIGSTVVLCDPFHLLLAAPPGRDLDLHLGSWKPPLVVRFMTCGHTFLICFP